MNVVLLVLVQVEVIDLECAVATTPVSRRKNTAQPSHAAVIAEGPLLSLADTSCLPGACPVSSVASTTERSSSSALPASGLLNRRRSSIVLNPAPSDYRSPPIPSFIHAASSGDQAPVTSVQSLVTSLAASSSCMQPEAPPQQSAGPATRAPPEFSRRRLSAIADELRAATFVHHPPPLR
jgi:hypothetical protein